MMDILKRIFIGIIVGMSIFFLKTEVFAMTVEGRYRYSDNNTSVDGSYTPAGTQFSFTTPNNSSHEYFLTRIFVRFTDTFTNGSTYRFEYNYNVDRYNIEYLNRPCPDSSAFTVGSGTIQSFSCSSNNGTVSIVLTWQSNSNVSSVTFGSVYGVMLAPNTTYKFRVLTDYLVSEVDSTQEAIYNNTAIISNAVEGVGSQIDIQTTIINNIHNLLSGLVQSDGYTEVDFDMNDPRNSSYISQHNSLNSIGESGTGSNGSGGLSFNPTIYEDASETIWDFIYDFLSLNSKLLTYLTSILTLGFVKVVLNR